MSDISEKIRKIIAKADTTTSPEEAEAFMAKAQQLMMEHGLSMLDLGRLDEDPINHELGVSRWYGGYHGKVCTAVAAYFGVRIVVSRVHGKNMINIFGRESARITYQLMIPYVFKQINKQASRAAKNGEYPTVSTAITRIGNAFAYLISEKNSENQEKHEGTGTNALVPVDLIREEMMRVFPNMRRKKPGRGSVDENAFKRAGNINLNRQVRSSSSRMITKQ